MIWLILLSIVMLGIGIYLWLWAADDEERLDHAYLNATNSFGEIWRANKRTIKRARIGAVALTLPFCGLLIWYALKLACQLMSFIQTL